MQVNPEENKKIESMMPAMLVSAAYDNITKSAVLKFYEPKSKELILWHDEMGHKPYCYSRLSPEELDFLQERDDVLKIKQVKKYDLIKDEEVDLSQITEIKLKLGNQT
jgi:DNA polymerase I